MLDKRERQELIQEEENLEMGHGYINQEQNIYATGSSPSMCKDKKRNSLGKEKKMIQAAKRPLHHTHKTKQVVSNNPRNPKSYKRKLAMVHHLYDPVEAKSSAMERAAEVQAYLGAEFPSLVKEMIPSNVTGGFWLGLPKKFCKMHLPSYDAIVVLVDEIGEEYETIYLAERTGLSGGWRRFSIEHKLLVSDVLVFQLVEPSKVKVYIVRANCLSEVDGALGLMSITHAKQNNFGHVNEKPLPLEFHEENLDKNSLVASNSNARPVIDQSENYSGKVSSDISEDRNYSRPVLNFNEVNSFENFTVLVNGLSIDTQLLKQVRTKYYELCCSQNSFLHDHLCKGTNCTLAVEMITETVNIANAIKACKLSTSQAKFKGWDKTLKHYEQLGMNVGFLRTRLKQLVTIAFTSEEALRSKRYRKVRLEHACVEEEMRNLELKHLELEELTKDLEVEIEALEVNDKRHKLMFDEEVNAPW